MKRNKQRQCMHWMRDRRDESEWKRETVWEISHSLVSATIPHDSRAHLCVLYTYNCIYHLFTLSSHKKKKKKMNEWTNEEKKCKTLHYIVDTICARSPRDIYDCNLICMPRIKFYKISMRWICVYSNNWQVTFEFF